LHLDHELTFPQLNGDLLRWHQALEPFGSANRQPTFFVRGVEPAVEPQVLKEKHLVLRLRQQSHFRRAIFFDGALAPLPKPPWDIAFRVNADEYEGETRLQIQVEALRATGPIE
jgi:single-stranded-DNA-specific exonuclease